MTHLIDTDWVIDFLNGASPAHTLMQQIRPVGIALSIITYTEVLEGVLGGRDPRRSEQGFRAFLSGTRIIGINRAVARETARIRLDLRRRGLSVNHRALDLVIAATAVTHGLTLVTRNTRHFSDINGLTIY